MGDFTQAHVPQLEGLTSQRLLELVQDCVLVRGLDGRALYWSRGAEILYGWDAAAVNGRLFDELMSTRFPESQAAAERSCRETGTWDGLLEQRRRDGRWIAVTSHWELLRDHQGAPAGMLEINCDTTVQRRDEARQQLRVTASGLFAAGAKWPQCAQELLRILTQGAGWDQAELWRLVPGSGEGAALQRYESWSRVPQPAAAIAGAAELVQRARVSGQPESAQAGEAELLALPVAVRGTLEPPRPHAAAPHAGHAHIAWVFVFHRIPQDPLAMQDDLLSPDMAGQLSRHIERAEALRALQQAEYRFRALLESAPDAMVIVDHHGLITLTNRRVQEMLGYSAEELHGQSIEVLLPPRLRAAHAEHWHEYYRDPRVRPMGVGMELTALHREGAELPVEISLSPIHLEGELLVAAAIRDTSERRRLEAVARRAHNLQLAEIEHRATLGEIAAGLAHEIKNPLAGMTAALDVLVSEASGPHREIMSDVREQANRIRNIVEDLLHYARPRPLQLQRGDLNATIAQVMPMATRTGQARGIAVTFQPGVLPPVEHDLDQVQRMVVNLVFNALDALSRGGRVEIATFERQGHALIEVRDDGPGIAAATLPKIFRPFFTTKGGKSSGLGLPLCQRIAELHAGSIRAESSQGHGATFTITLPVAMPAEARSELAGARLTAGGGLDAAARSTHAAGRRPASPATDSPSTREHDDGG